MLCAAAWACALTGGTARSDDAPTAHDPTAAAAHFSEAERAFEAGDFVRAATEFEASYHTNPHPTSLWNAAKSWDKALEMPRAANLYRRFLDEAPKDTPFRDLAHDALKSLSQKLGRIEVVAPGATRVRVDDKPLDRSLVWFVSPGAHLVSAEIDGELVSREVTLGAAETRSVALARAKVESEPPKPEPPARVKPATDAPRGATPWLLAPFAGTTALGVGLLIWSGADTLVARSQYDELAPADQAAVYDQGKLKQDRTNVILGVTAGLGLLTTALAVFAIDWGEGRPLVAIGPHEVTFVVGF